MIDLVVAWSGDEADLSQSPQAGPPGWTLAVLFSGHVQVAATQSAEIGG